MHLSWYKKVSRNKFWARYIIYIFFIYLQIIPLYKAPLDTCILPNFHLYYGKKNINDYKKDLEIIEEVTSNVDEVKKRVLADILSQNAHVEYLQVD